MAPLVQSLLGLAVLVAVVRAAPLPAPSPLFGINLGSGDESDATPTPVSQDSITSSLLRPAQFARVAYCSAAVVTNWSCGAPCDAIPNVNVLVTGGDEGLIPRFFVAQDPDTQTIIVAHEGTDPEKILSIANDVEFGQVSANSTLFPQASGSVKLHDGFQETQARTADLVLSTVQSALSSTGYKSVLVTGHSLGAAITTLDAAMLKMALPSDINVDAVGFGLPRVGNSDWADLFDSLVPNFKHVTNQHDIVPNVPPQALEFQHPSGELHIKSVDDTSGDATIVACAGQENENCADGNSLLDVSIPNHLGPYFADISFGNDACAL